MPVKLPNRFYKPIYSQFTLKMPADGAVSVDSTIHPDL
jgi:hypothetical protein